MLDTTVDKRIKPAPGSYDILVIPVVTASSPFDPDDNLLNDYDPEEPDLRQVFINRWEEVVELWDEASYGQIQLHATVLNRYYQMPLDADDYYNPDYIPAEIIGRPVVSPSADLPGGDVTLRLHISDADDANLTLHINGANSPFTHADLQEALMDQVDPDRLEIEVGLDNRVRIRVAQRHVGPGTYVQILDGQSDANLVSALGLDESEGTDGQVVAMSVNTAFPISAPTDETVGIRLVYESGGNKDFLWSIPNGSSFPSAVHFANAHGDDVADAIVSEFSGEIRFELEADAGEVVVDVLFDAVDDSANKITAKWGFDEALWGMDEVIVTEGVVTHAKRDTMKRDGDLVVGEAIAAYLLNELTRPPGGGADSIPNIPIVAANKGQLDDIFGEQVDDYHSIVALFLDISGKRAQAGGGALDIGIQNGGYLYTYQTKADRQTVFRGTGSGTLSHETGHNIGFPDLYNNSSGNYDEDLNYPQDYDIMDNSNLHHPGARAKMIVANWVQNDGGSIDVFPEPADGDGAETRHYVITPLEYSISDYDNNLNGIPANHDVVKVVRLPLGYGNAADDHYLLVQNRQPGDMFNLGLPTAPAASDAGGIYISDVISSNTYNYFKINTRNFEHPLTDQPLLTGKNVTPILDFSAGDDIDLEASYPAYDGISVNVVDELSGPGGIKSFVVEVTREREHFLDLRIEPWGAPPYESPDIWIEHGDKSPGELSNTPLEGNGDETRWDEDYDPDANGGEPLNWVRVLVSNNGTIEARDVVVRVVVNQPGGIGDSGDWTYELPLSEPRDIPADGEAIFNIPWNPAVGEHTCLKVEIFDYDSDLSDLTPSNNGTQENINHFSPTSHSPFQPYPFQVEVFNPFDYEMDFKVVAEDVPYGMTVEIPGSFFTLPAHSSKIRNLVLHIDSSVYLPPTPNGSGGLNFYYEDPNVGTLIPTNRFWERFHIVGYGNPDGDSFVPVGGVTYDINPTTTTELSAAATADVGVCQVFVLGGTTPPAGHQNMEVRVRYPSGRTEWIKFKTAANGSFSASFEPKEGGPLELQVIYPPGGLFAPTRTDKFNAFVPWNTIELHKDPEAGGTVSGDGCYMTGQMAVLAAHPNPGFVFGGWHHDSTGELLSNGNPYVVAVKENLKLTAKFEIDPDDPKGTTYENWLAANHFKAGAMEGDDDRNGIFNAAEFYYNQNPLDPDDTGHMPKIISNGKQVEIHYTKLMDPQGVEGGFEIATSLGDRGGWRAAVEGRDYRVVSVTRNRVDESVVLQVNLTNADTLFFRFFVRGVK